MGWLQQFAVPCLVTSAAMSLASAGGVRAGRSTATAARSLQTSASESLGCFQDSKSDRRLSRGLMAQDNMTPEVCREHCLGRHAYYAVQYGKECWCGSDGAEYDKLGVLSAEDCGMPCTGDASLTCGGYNTFEIFAYPVVPQPEGHLGCYADDKRDRLFEIKTTSADLTAETCKATCSADSKYAYYGLQYGSECWCGSATDDYTRHGVGSCSYSCTGDAAAVCGGYTNMNIFSIDGTTTTDPSATVAPTTAPPTTMPPTTGGTAAGTTAPPTTMAPTAQGTTATTVPPTTMAPTTGGTAAGATASPTTMAPTTGGTAAGTTASPTTMAPTTQGTTATTVPPTTMAPSTAGPSTLSPTDVPPISAGAVLVDLVPCILSPKEISEATSGPYVMQQFFKGYWTPKTIIEIVSTADNIFSLLTDDTDATRGLCNAVYVGIPPTDSQYAELAAYSAQFKVRIVYFDQSVSYDNAGVKAKLGIEPWYEGDILIPERIQLTEDGRSLASITSPTLMTDPRTNNLFIVPTRRTTVLDNVAVLAEYASEDGTPITSDGLDSAALMTVEGDDGSEEMYAFFPIAWFDTGSWAWAHYFNEWATKGIFMGERRFYLGAVVDDLFLATPEWKYTEDEDEGEEEVGSRCGKQDLINLRAVQDELNNLYDSAIITEFANNGAGILEKVESIYTPPYEETAVTVKGTKWFEDGQANVHDPNWLADSVPGMQQDFADKKWDGDELLMEVLNDLAGSSPSFYHQSHTLIHLSRDQLREPDCFTEDTGNVQIALLTGMWDSDYYNWRSMVSPGITGLFNKFCLDSGAKNLMTCYPGDNTYDGTTEGAVYLVNEEEPYHSIYTTEEANDYEGIQIVPRFATFVYFNCVTGKCLVEQNEKIRRDVCECASLNPAEDKGECASTEEQCVDAKGDTDIQSFQTIEEVFDTESATTTRYLLAGRRDKYMFHQANIIPADDLPTNDLGDNMSTLEYWYRRVMEEFSKLITFPVKSVKFDDLCTNFQHHEALDSSGGYVTMTVEEDGTISDMSYNAGSGAGLVPLTVPTNMVASVPITSLADYEHSSEEYGTDTTYYLADAKDLIPTPAVKPDRSLLAEVPAKMSAAEEAETIIEPDPEADAEREEETKEAIEENEEVLNEQGFAAETP